MRKRCFLKSPLLDVFKKNSVPSTLDNDIAVCINVILHFLIIVNNFMC